ncbi:hypothetical protein QQP08_004142 [Theobroma cacao]|nr:hypothetical protein QQP08_004142 [Theobroma cacao]
MDTYIIEEFSATAFIKSMVDRSHGNATALILPEPRSDEALEYVADKMSLPRSASTARTLVVLCASNARIEEDEALDIVTLLPKIAHLFLEEESIEQKNLQLVYLDVSDCIGFNEDDDEMLELASYITAFNSCWTVIGVVCNEGI